MIIIRLTSHEHDADREDLLSVCIGAHISKSYTGQTAESEVQRGDVGAGHGWPAHGAVNEWGLQPFSQLL